MGHVNTELAINALEIRDTSDHTGTTINNYDFRLKTIVVENAAPFIPYFGMSNKFNIMLSTNAEIIFIKISLDFPIIEIKLCEI